ncbi:hypothetical protein AMATHDRAFT_48178 [Amanita thiersii Skay4041]|uniref:Condensation domain-containing protein n=1 Tax=Amanita thiersii Skay4041 TaxID=703135 RepID=A0A2A9NJ62_9AGAR|nr:hypothetical protein AMATHDRAFT_48178 [Amanita thiersii Skay4041]
MNTVDFNRYKWREDEKVPGRFKREPGGGELFEDVLNLTKHGEQNLFVGVYAALAIALDTGDLLAAVLNSWISLRWEIPTVAAQTGHEPSGKPLPTSFITYDVARSLDEVKKWANTTVILREDKKNLDDLRYEIGQDPIPAADLVPQTYLYLVPYTPTTFGILFHTAHTTFDGAGSKIVLTKLFTYLYNYLSQPSYQAEQEKLMKWGTEAQNLLPMVTEILRKHEPAVLDAQGNVIMPEVPEEPREGEKYFETLNEVMTGLATGGPRAYPFKSLIQPPYNPQTTKPKTRRVEYRLSVSESVRIKAAGAVGGSITQKLTVNHLVHGALSLLPILDNPPPKDTDAVIFYYGLVDGRQRLAKEYRSPLGYPGYCLGMSSIQIPVSLYNKLPHDDKKTMVLEYAKVVQKEYKRQTEFPSLLAIEPQQVDLMLSVPPPPPWCGPWYAADGRGNVYLHPKYPATGPTVIEITDFFLGLNKCDPGPFFRAYEWNGQLILSADFNELAVEPKVVQGWMEKWADLLRSLMV